MPAHRQDADRQAAHCLADAGLGAAQVDQQGVGPQVGADPVMQQIQDDLHRGSQDDRPGVGDARLQVARRHVDDPLLESVVQGRRVRIDADQPPNLAPQRQGQRAAHQPQPGDGHGLLLQGCAHSVRSTASATRRNSRIIWAKRSGVSDCIPSETASSGLG